MLFAYYRDKIKKRNVNFEYEGAELWILLVRSFKEKLLQQ